MASYAEEFLHKAKSNVDASFESVGVLPGDSVTDNVTHFKSAVKLGSGLSHDGDAVTATIGGVLRYRPPATYFVESVTMRYTPKTGDHIVGVVEDKGGDFYRVNMFAGTAGFLGRLAFEGATKRNKPELKKGDFIYARVHLAHKDIDTELTCLAASGVKKDWSSGESIFGELPGGQLLNVSLQYAKTLLAPDCVVLNSLAKHYAFEVAVGANGVVWIKSGAARTSVVIRNALLNAASTALSSDAEVQAMVSRLVEMAKLDRT